MSLSGRRWRACLWLVFRLRCFGCAVFLPAAVFWLRRFCCSGGLVSQGRCAHRNGAQGSQGLGGGLFWGMVGCCAVFGCAVFCLRLFFGFAVFAVRGAVLGGGWYRKVAALTAMVRKDRKGLAGGSSGGWYRKVAALTATKKWGAGATLLSAQGSQGLGGGMVGCCAVFCCAVFACGCFWLRRFLAAPFLLFWGQVGRP